MRNTKTRIRAWLPAAAPTVLLIGLSFCVGTIARSRHDTLSARRPNASVQANAMLNSAPELSPVTLRSPGTDAPSERREGKQLFTTVFQLLRATYVDPISPQRETEMARGAVRGMVDSLGDPDSRFLDPKDRAILEESGNGYFRGIGAVLALRKEKVGDMETIRVMVVSPMPGSPAEAAGLKAGDSIEYMDGKWIITRSPFAEVQIDKLQKKVLNGEMDELEYKKQWEAADKKLRDGVVIPTVLDTLASKVSGQVKLRVVRAGVGKPIDLTLPCRVTNVTPVTSRTLTGGIAYVHIAQFNQRAVAQFAKRVSALQSGATKGLVLDLRDNPGGLMSAAANIGGKIAGSGLFATIQGTGGKRTVTVPQGKKLGVPVVVLVNGGTASVSELLAGTLRDSVGAVIEGSATFGDGTIQTPLLLGDGSSAVVTTGKMLTRGGVDFDRKGISPDVQVKQDADPIETARKAILSRLGKA